MDNKAEQERKELNKKFLKKTFISELKSRKKIKLLELVIEFVAISIALILSNIIVNEFSIHFWLVELIIAAGLIMIMLYIGSLFSKKRKDYVNLKS